MQLSFNLIETFGLSIIVLLIGRGIVKRINFLNKFCIPAPVVGGLLFSIINLILYSSGTVIIEINTTLRDFFMVSFFTTVGFGASLAILKKGGVGVAVFWLVASILCILQNVIGVGISVAMGENPLLGLAVGSVTMTGGHPTAAAFSEALESAGLSGAMTITAAAATFGLLSGSLMGGPVASRIIHKKNLQQTGNGQPQAGNTLNNLAVGLLNSKDLANAFFQIAIAMFLGSYVSKLIALAGITVPAQIGAIIIAAIMRNVFKDGTKRAIKLAEINALGEIFLGVFLSQALMSLKLWELKDLALPLIVILFAQVILMYFYAQYITFKIMGSDYDAAVLTSGHCGFGLGSTPNGMANMTAIVSKYYPAPKPFFILPIVGGLFIDISNMIVITIFLNIFGK